MVNLLDSELSRKDHENAEVADRIMELIKDDQYLSEQGLLPEELQTIGYMRGLRGAFDYLGSVEEVKISGNQHVKALQNFKLILEAAMTSITQHKAEVVALQKAKKEEAEAQRKEELRQQKQKQKEKEQAAKREQKAIEKEEKKRAKAVQAETKDKDEEKRHRRGQGVAELTEDDISVLRSKFPGRGVKVVSTAEGLCEAISCGVPCVWRCGRSAVKKLLDHSFLEDKEVKSGVSAVKADVLNFVGETNSYFQARLKSISSPTVNGHYS